MIQYVLKYKTTLTGILFGAILGYAYYYFVGCASGSCSITSNPINSCIYGSLLGGSFFNLFEKKHES